MDIRAVRRHRIAEVHLPDRRARSRGDRSVLSGSLLAKLQPSFSVTNFLTLSST
jgi:hypothetical protein